MVIAVTSPATSPRRRSAFDNASSTAPIFSPTSGTRKTPPQGRTASRTNPLVRGAEVPQLPDLLPAVSGNSHGRARAARGAGLDAVLSGGAESVCVSLSPLRPAGKTCGRSSVSIRLRLTSAFNRFRRDESARQAGENAVRGMIVKGMENSSDYHSPAKSPPLETRTPKAFASRVRNEVRSPLPPSSDFGATSTSAAAFQWSAAHRPLCPKLAFLVGRAVQSSNGLSAGTSGKSCVLRVTRVNPRLKAMAAICVSG